MAVGENDIWTECSPGWGKSFSGSTYGVQMNLRGVKIPLSNEFRGFFKVASRNKKKSKLSARHALDSSLGYQMVIVRNPSNKIPGRSLRETEQGTKFVWRINDFWTAALIPPPKEDSFQTRIVGTQSDNPP